MPSSGPRAKHWRFHIITPSKENINHLSQPLTDVSYITYENETPSRGIISFNNRKRTQQVLRITQADEVSVCINSMKEIKAFKQTNSLKHEHEYVSKLPKKKQTPWEKFKTSVQLFKQEVITANELKKLHEDIYQRYPSFVDDLIESLSQKTEST